MIAISKITLEYMSRYLLTEKEAYMAMLMAAGAEQAEAYSIMFPNNFTTKKALDEEATKLCRAKKGIKDLSNILTRVNMKGLSENPEKGKKKKKVRKDGLDINSKDSILEALKDQYDMALTAKDKSAILIKIADLQQMKKEETNDQDDLVHFMLPLTCSYCNLYIENKKKKEEEEEMKK